MPKPESSDLSTSSVVVLLEALRDRQVSALELTDAAILRIQRLDGPINAVVVRDFDRARDQAKAADGAIARGERRPLLGIPMTLKEAFNLAGLATTWGFPAFKSHVAATTSVAVGRLLAAGAVVLGKTNVPPFLADWQSSNPIYGRTNNPWDLMRTPGGSSGGSAAAVAAGMVPLEFGSDLGGSIRVPAAFCGIFGHKPSFGIVPMRGFAPPGVDGAGIPISVLGPMARTAADLELALAVVAGPAGDDETGYRLVLPPPRHTGLANHRVLIIDHHPAAALDTEIQTALHTFANRLEAQGAKVTRGSPLVPDLMLILECFGTMLGTITSRGGPPRQGPLTAHGWMDLLDRQEMVRRSWATLFASFDVVLAPAFGTAAFPHQDDLPMNERVLTINGHSTPYAAQGAWSSIASLANLPSTVAPIGETAIGLPIGIQIIGPYLEDRTTIGFSGLIEQEFGGVRSPPIG